jgi:hypothetical protein
MILTRKDMKSNEVHIELERHVVQSRENRDPGQDQRAQNAIGIECCSQMIPCGIQIGAEELPLAYVFLRTSLLITHIFH